MRNLRLLISSLFLTLQIGGFCQSPGCSDSSYRKYFYIENDSLESVGKIDQADGGQLILGRHKIQNETFESGLLIRLDPLGNLLWSKDCIHSSNGEQFRFIRGIALSTGEYLVIGRITSLNDPLFNKSALVKISPGGGLIWSKVIDLDPAVDAAPLIQIQSACEGLNGDILVSGTVYTNLNANFAGQGGLIMKISAAGNLIFSRLHLPEPGTVNDLISVFVKNNKILLFGYVEDAACIADARGGIYSMTMDYNTGNVINNNRYCLSTSDNLNSYAIYLHNYEVRQTAGGYILYGYLSESGPGARDFLVESFDQDGLLQSGLSITDHLIAKYYHNIAIDDNGGIHLMGITPSNGLYGSVLTKNGALISQTKADFPNFDKLYYFEAGQKLSADTKGFSNYINNSSAGGHSAITLIHKFTNSNFKSACLGADTAFTTLVENLGFTPTPFAVKQTIYDAMLFSNLPVTIQDNGLKVQEQCNLASQCSDLKISGPDTVCQGIDFVELKVIKNSDCFQKLEWTFDSVSITQAEPQTDSSVRIHFKKRESGTHSFEIKVSSNGCVNLNTSHIVSLLSGQNSIVSSNVCDGDSIKLSPGNSFATYRWNDGSSDSTLFVKEGGAYTVETGTSNCLLNDTFQVSDFQKIRKVDLGPDLIVCVKENLVLHGGAGFKSYNWQDESGDSLMPATKTGNYSLRAIDGCGVISSDTVHVTINPCTSLFRMPSGFSPNNDGINDVIRPTVRGKLEKYLFQIYNRWGQRVFESTNPTFGWDGRINNAMQQTAAFAWFCVYKFSDEKEKRVSGTFMLLN